MICRFNQAPVIMSHTLKKDFDFPEIDLTEEHDRQLQNELIQNLQACAPAIEESFTNTISSPQKIKK